ncbi:hypothetical protein BDC45DRAFT_568237 [Circinella umbellata]|nr:hypothetical protein BDC45DRAFT_568237 [Circinella umbellata]
MVMNIESRGWAVLLFLLEVEVTSSTVLAIFNGAVNGFRTIKTRSGVTGGFVPLGGAEEDGISADGLVERRQGSVSGNPPPSIWNRCNADDNKRLCFRYKDPDL